METKILPKAFAAILREAGWSCMLLAVIPTAILGVALKFSIEEAKQQVVNMVDEEFIKAFNEWPKQ